MGAIGTDPIVAQMIVKISLPDHDNRNLCSVRRGSPLLFGPSNHHEYNPSIHTSGTTNQSFPKIHACSEVLSVLPGRMVRGWLRYPYMLESPVISSVLPCYTLTRSVAVSRYNAGQIPGLYLVQKCSSGKLITSIHHEINCSLRSFASILTHLITYTLPNYIKPPTHQPFTGGL